MNNVLTVKFNQKEFEQVNSYAKATKTNVSKIMKNLLLNMINDDFLYDESIVSAIKKAEKDKSYSFKEARKLVGV